jgi:hypothetical protein
MAIRRSIFLASVRFARNGLDVQEITDFPAISESEALKLKKISPAGTHHHRRVSQKNYSNLSVGVLFEYSQSASLPAQKPGGEVVGAEIAASDLLPPVPFFPRSPRSM